ncbi:MAG: VTT domain-containing protein [Acidobacteria bacterium]|nr:VTT domain-containing protein [Acidobacteriota bacterium]
MPRIPRSLLLVIAIATCVIATKLVLENGLGLDLGIWLESVARPGATSASLILTLLAVDIVLPVPSSLVMIASGALFGVIPGAAISLTGSLLGEWLGFELARRFGLPAARWIAGDADLARLQAVMHTHGIAAVVASRALPVLMETLSVVAGLSGMSRRAFLWSSLVGTAPIVIVYAWAGAWSRDAGTVVPAIIMLLAVAGAGWIAWRAARHARA